MGNVVTENNERKFDDIKAIVERKPFVPKKRSRDEKLEKAMEKFVKEYPQH